MYRFRYGSEIVTEANGEVAQLADIIVSVTPFVVDVELSLLVIVAGVEQTKVIAQANVVVSLDGQTSAKL